MRMKTKVQSILAGTKGLRFEEILARSQLPKEHVEAALAELLALRVVEITNEVYWLAEIPGWVSRARAAFRTDQVNVPNARFKSKYDRLAKQLTFYPVVVERQGSNVLSLAIIDLNEIVNLFEVTPMIWMHTHPDYCEMSFHGTIGEHTAWISIRDRPIADARPSDTVIPSVP